MAAYTDNNVPAVDDHVLACPGRLVTTTEGVKQSLNGSTITIAPVDRVPCHLKVGACGGKTMRGWVIGKPLTQLTNTESAVTCYDYSQDWPDPVEKPPDKPAPTCPPWKFSAQRDKRHSHRRTNKKGRR